MSLEFTFSKFWHDLKHTEFTVLTFKVVLVAFSVVFPLKDTDSSTTLKSISSSVHNPTDTGSYVELK